MVVADTVGILAKFIVSLDALNLVILCWFPLKVLLMLGLLSDKAIVQICFDTVVKVRWLLQLAFDVSQAATLFRVDRRILELYSLLAGLDGAATPTHSPRMVRRGRAVTELDHCIVFSV